MRNTATQLPARKSGKKATFDGTRFRLLSVPRRVGVSPTQFGQFRPFPSVDVTEAS